MASQKKFQLRDGMLGASVLLIVMVSVILALFGAFTSGKPQAMGALAAEPVALPMELGGKWLGMSLVSADSSTARQLGVDPTAIGIIVSEVDNSPGSRAFQAGVLPGDMLVAMDGNKVKDLAELYTMSTGRLDVARPLPMEVIRRGRPLTLVLPAPAPMQPMMAPGMGTFPNLYPAPGMANAAMPAPPAQMQNAAMMQEPGMAPAMEAQAARFACPVDRQVLDGTQVGPDRRCPRCGNQLIQIQ